jgi:F-type H+-transporting ATPase subunit c
MDQTIVVQYSLIAAAIIASVASLVAAYSDSRAATHAIDGMVRQPELAGTLFTNMLVAIGLIESIPIIAVVIAIVLVFANPFLG